MPSFEFFNKIRAAFLNLIAKQGIFNSNPTIFQDLTLILGQTNNTKMEINPHLTAERAHIFPEESECHFFIYIGRQCNHDQGRYAPGEAVLLHYGSKLNLFRMVVFLVLRNIS